MEVNGPRERLRARGLCRGCGRWRIRGFVGDVFDVPVLEAVGEFREEPLGYGVVLGAAEGDGVDARLEVVGGELARGSVGGERSEAEALEGGEGVAGDGTGIYGAEAVMVGEEAGGLGANLESRGDGCVVEDFLSEAAAVVVGGADKENLGGRSIHWRGGAWWSSWGGARRE